MKKSFSLLLIVATISCSTIIDNDHNYSPIPKTETQSDNDLICSYAQILASAMNNPELKKVLKKEAQAQFDGDFDVLTTRMEELPVNGKDVCIRQLLSDQPITTRSRSCETALDINVLMDRIKERFPNLQVSIPVHCDEWDTEGYTPLVAYLPVDFDERSATTIEAFDTEGRSHLLSATEEPTFPVIVVSVSERIDANGNSIFDSDYTDEGVYIEEVLTKSILDTPSGLSLGHSTSRSLELSWNSVVSDGYYEIQRRALNESTFSTIAQIDGDENFFKDIDLADNTKYSYRMRLINGDSQSAYSQIVTTTASERNSGEALKVVWYKMSKSLLQAVEPWENGRPEIRMIVFYGTTSGSDVPQVYSQLLSPTRDHIKDGCNPNATVLPSWDPSTNGSVLTFVWTEEDNSGSYVITADVKYENKTSNGTITSGTSGTYNGSYEHTELGRGYVCWWNPYSTIFNHGIQFRLGTE